MGRSRVFQIRSATTIVLVAVVALTLGALGTFSVSYAAGVTADQAKAIAKKVVKKEGKKLTVKNAKKLGGKPASAYRDKARVYYTTVASAQATVYITVPELSPGTPYRITYYAFLAGAPSGNSGCNLRRSVGVDVKQFYADEYGDGPSPAYSGMAVLTVPAGQKVQLYCVATGPWTTWDDLGSVGPIQITVEELDQAAVDTLPIAVRPAGTPRR